MTGLLLSKLLDLLFPPRCIFCGALSEDGDICRSCAQEAEKLALSVPEMREENRSRRLEFVEDVCAPYAYADGAAEVVRRFKFRENAWLAPPMARAVAGCVRDCFAGVGFDLAVSVPSNEPEHRHSDHLARKTAWLLGCPYDGGVLRKLRDTRKQHDLDEAGRAHNLEDAFWADERAVRGQTVLICDDVITSGNTVNECAKALLRAGACAVYACSFAATGRLGHDGEAASGGGNDSLNL